MRAGALCCTTRSADRAACVGGLSSSRISAAAPASPPCSGHVTHVPPYSAVAAQAAAAKGLRAIATSANFDCPMARKMYGDSMANCGQHNLRAVCVVEHPQVGCSERVHSVVAGGACGGHLCIDDLRDDLEVNSWEDAAELPSDSIVDHLLRPPVHSPPSPPSQPFAPPGSGLPPPSDLLDRKTRRRYPVGARRVCPRWRVDHREDRTPGTDTQYR